MLCQNCKKYLSCGCERKTANDGTQCCNSCVNSYNSTLKIQSKKDDQVLTPEQQIRIYGKLNT